MLSAEQLEQRKAGIGGSDIGAVLGFSPYKTPLDVYNEKLGFVQPADLSSNDSVHFGNVLEDTVASEFSRRTGFKVRRNNNQLAHRDYPFLLANIDRDIVGKPFGLKCGLECKTTDKWAARPELWGEGAALEFDSGGEPHIVDYDEKVPDWYLMQCAHYMAVTDADMWFLAVLIGGNDFRFYTIQRNMKLEKAMIARASAFWQHVLEETPPPPTNVVDLEAMFSIDNGKSITATPEIVDAYVRSKEIQAQMKALETELEGQTIGKTKLGGLKNKIRMFIGEHSEVVLDGEGKPLATWKAPKNGRKFFDQESLKRDDPATFRKYYKTVPGSRTLLFK